MKDGRGPKFDYHRASSVLAEASVYGDIQALKNARLSKQSLRNYRRMLNTDTTLLHMFAHKKKTLEDAWADELAPTIRSGIKFISKATLEANPADPEAIKAVSGAIQMLTSVDMTRRVLDARIDERQALNINPPPLRPDERVASTDIAAN